VDPLAARLTALFANGGRSVLKEAGAPDWEAFARLIPGEARSLDLPTLILRLRDDLSAKGRYRAAAALTRGILTKLESADKVQGTLVAEVRGRLGSLMWRDGRREEGARLMERALEVLQRSPGASQGAAGSLAGELARHRVHESKWGEAEALLREALASSRKHAPATTGLLAAQLAEVLVQQERWSDASVAAREAWDQHVVQAGEDAPRTISRARIYGKILIRMGRHEEARAPLQQVFLSVDGGTGESAADAAFDLGVTLDEVGQPEAALRLIEQSIRLTRDARQVSGKPPPTMADRLGRYAEVLMRRGRTSEVEGLLLESFEVERELHGDVSGSTGERHLMLAGFYLGQGRRGEAMGRLEAGSSLLRSVHGDQDRRVRIVVGELVDTLLQDIRSARDGRDRELARDLLSGALGPAREVLGEEDERTQSLVELAKKLGV
jgi:tetratricopeptide (TPR) repeat protein